MEERGERSDSAILPPAGEGDGRLADNIVFFARALRRAGIKIGPGAIADAIDAVALIGIGGREAFTRRCNASSSSATRTCRFSTKLSVCSGGRAVSSRR